VSERVANRRRKQLANGFSILQNLPVDDDADSGTEAEAGNSTNGSGRWTREELLGRFDVEQHPEFSRIPSGWTDKQEAYLRKEALDAYGSMREAASDDGIDLLIRSAARSYDYQCAIWERKWQLPKYEGWQPIDRARDILSYSAMPGTSRHHWGTDIDLNSIDNEWFVAGEGMRVYEWLCAHASAHGFHQTYDDKSSGRTGYELERWHWSYLPLARPMLDAYNDMVVLDDLKGFSGAASAGELRVLHDFVNGVDLPPRAQGPGVSTTLPPS
jgi:D-alanyl-D-alanine carboxypeptidase